MSYVLNNVKIVQSCFRSLIPNISHLKTLSPFLQNSHFDSNHANGSFRQLHISLPRYTVKPRDRKDLLRGLPKLEEGTVGEFTESVGAPIKKKEDMFIDERTPDLLFNGVRFADLPIVSIRVTKNNTIVSLADPKGKPILIRSCGIEGFKNARKGTNVAAQATALTFSQKALNIGIKDVRVKVRGLGPGRMASIKGLQLGGMNIISLTDDTRVTFKLTQRPKKPRRL